MLSMTKKRQDNDVTNCTGAIYYRPLILSLATCMYLGGVARTQFLNVTAMEPLLGLIGFRTSHEFTYGSIDGFFRLGEFLACFLYLGCLGGTFNV